LVFTGTLLLIFTPSFLSWSLCGIVLLANKMLLALPSVRCPAPLFSKAAQHPIFQSAKVIKVVVQCWPLQGIDGKTTKRHDVQ
jgi:hypothetical protein